MKLDIKKRRAKNLYVPPVHSLVQASPSILLKNRVDSEQLGVGSVDKEQGAAEWLDRRLLMSLADTAIYT